MVREIAKKIIIIDKVIISPFNNIEKIARSGITFKFSEIETNPEKQLEL